MLYLLEVTLRTAEQHFETCVDPL